MHHTGNTRHIMGLVRSFIGTDGIWQYIPHINTGLFSIIKVHFLLFANLIVDWHINTINFTDSGNKDNKQDRRTMAIIRHMRRSAFSAGKSDSRNRLESGGIRVNMLTR